MLHESGNCQKTQIELQQVSKTTPSNMVWYAKCGEKHNRKKARSSLLIPNVVSSGIPAMQSSRPIAPANCAHDLGKPAGQRLILDCGVRTPRLLPIRYR